MEDQIRDGFSYEMTISFNITTAGHLCEVDKDRTRMFVDKPDFVITEKTGELIKQWCEQGIDVNKVHKEELTSAIAGLALAETKKDLIDFKKTLPAYIVEDASFIAAGKQRYEAIMAKAI